MKVKEESEKAGLKLNIQKMKIMASNTINARQIDGETMETVTDLILLGSKIIADGECSHEIRRRLLLGRKAVTNLNIRVTYGCESWTVNKAEHQRTDAFELWFWRRLLRVP